jgi:hypothetical protein
MFALLLLLLTQDPDVSKLVEDLAAEQPAVRETAAAALVARGAGIEPELRRRLTTAEGELKFRLKDCLARIERAREDHKVLPPFKPVDVDVAGRTLSEALASIGLKSQGVPNRKVTLSAKGLSPLEALDRLCRESGLSWSLDAPEPRRDAILRFSERPFAEKMRVYVGHYRIAMSSATVADDASLKLDLRLAWPPYVKPDAVVQFDLVSVLDDTARSLLEAKPAEPTADLPDRAGFARTFILCRPAPAAGTLASVKGRVVMRYPARFQTARFAPPGDCVGQTLTVSGLSVTLNQVETKGNGLEVELKFAGDYVRCFSEKDKPLAREGRWSQPFEREQVRFETGDGAELKWFGVGAGSNGKAWTLSWSFFKPAVPLKAIEVVLPSDSFYDTFDFELKDVPLPKQPK